MGFPWNVLTSSLKYLCPLKRENGMSVHLVYQILNAEFHKRKSDSGLLTCWASVSDWNVMYQLLLCANSTLITFGQFSFLKRASTSWKREGKDKCYGAMTLRDTQAKILTSCKQCYYFPFQTSVVGLTSTGVVSGTSLRMMMQRLWFGRTFSPFSSTWTIGEAGSQAVKRQHPQATARPNTWLPPPQK